MRPYSQDVRQRVLQAIDAGHSQAEVAERLSVSVSKLKTILRRVGARTREALQDAIIEALPRITSQDALSWFLHCGYPAPSIGETAE